MKNTATITWIVLIVLTITSAVVSKLDSKYVVLIILLLSGIKFLGIAFQFMEIKKAHVFWENNNYWVCFRFWYWVVDCFIKKIYYEI